MAKLTTEKAINFLKNKIENDELDETEMTEIFELIENECEEIKSLKANVLTIDDFETTELITELNSKGFYSDSELNLFDDEFIETFLQNVATRINNKELREFIVIHFKMNSYLSHENFAKDFLKEVVTNIYNID